MSALPLYYNEDVFYNMHDTMLFEILKRLQPKDLLRCRCVQKSWYYIIKTPDFIKLHLNYHEKHVTTARDSDGDGGDPKYLLFRWAFGYGGPIYLHYDDEQCQEFNKLELPPFILERGVCWLATSSGLICVATRYFVAGSRSDMTIYLWNPLIKKFRTLPALDLSHISLNWMTLAFGYVPLINDYHVVRIVNYCNEDKYKRSSLVCFYSLKTNSWKTKYSEACNDIQSVMCYESVFVNGFSCWRVWNEAYTFVLYFDSLNEILGTILLPQMILHTYHCLHQFGQSVALFVELRELNAFNMWILKKDSPKSEFFWENKVSVTLQKPIYGEIVGVRNNGELVLVSKSETVHGLVSYDPQNNLVKGFVESWKHRFTRFHVYPFVGNLVLLDTD